MHSGFSTILTFHSLKVYNDIKMGDEVEIEEIFDADLLSGSEDEEDAPQEEALLGVDAVWDKFTFLFFLCSSWLAILNLSYSISRSPQVTWGVLLRGLTLWILTRLVKASTQGTLTLRMRGSRRGGRRKDRLLSYSLVCYNSCSRLIIQGGVREAKSGNVRATEHSGTGHQSVQCTTGEDWW